MQITRFILIIVCYGFFKNSIAANPIGDATEEILRLNNNPLVECSDKKSGQLSMRGIEWCSLYHATQSTKMIDYIYGQLLNVVQGQKNKLEIKKGHDYFLLSRSQNCKLENMAYFDWKNKPSGSIGMGNVNFSYCLMSENQNQAKVYVRLLCPETSESPGDLDGCEPLNLLRKKHPELNEFFKVIK